MYQNGQRKDGPGKNWACNKMAMHGDATKCQWKNCNDLIKKFYI